MKVVYQLMKPMRDELQSNHAFWERQGQTILVTGAHSLLGHRVVERLAASGWVVRVLTPVGTMGQGKFPKRVFEVEGSLTRIADLQNAVQDCARVLHLAECTMSRDSKQFMQENTENTRNLISACKRVGISQFILLSSSSVALRKLTNYARSKKIAEDVLRGSGIPWVIVRPSLIVGTDGGSEYQWLRAAIRRFPFIPLPEGGHAVKRPIHEDDLADGLERLLRTAPTVVSRKVYHLSGKESYTTAELVSLIASEHQIPQRTIIGLPSWMCHLFARIADRIHHIPFEVSQALQTLAQDADHDIDQAVQDFGFNPNPLVGRLNQSIRHLQGEMKGTLRQRNPLQRITRGLSLIRKK